MARLFRPKGWRQETRDLKARVARAKAAGDSVELQAIAARYFDRSAEESRRAEAWMLVSAGLMGVVLVLRMTALVMS